RRLLQARAGRGALARPRPGGAGGGGRPPPLSTVAPAMASVLAFRPGAIGDFVLALPALAALRAAFRDAPLTVVGPAAALPLARAAGVADATLAADDARLTPLFAGSAADVAPELRPTHAALWAGPSAAPLAETLRTLGAARVIHVPSRPPPDARQHVADYLLASLAPLGVQALGRAVPTVRPTPAALAAAAEFLAGYEAPPQSP